MNAVVGHIMTLARDTQWRSRGRLIAFAFRLLLRDFAYLFAAAAGSIFVLTLATAPATRQNINVVIGSFLALFVLLSFYLVILRNTYVKASFIKRASRNISFLEEFLGSSRISALTSIGAIAKNAEEHVPQSTKNFDELALTVYQNLQQVVEYAVDALNRYTGSGCAVTIKLLHYDQPALGKSRNEPRIYTFIRNETARAKRRFDIIPDFFPYSANTAFSALLQDLSLASFSSDDLRSMQLAGKYRNANPVWHKYYNATVVTPIRRKVDDETYSVLGFLCVDSLSGQLNDAAVRRKLALLAEYLYSAIGLLYAYAESTSAVSAADTGLIVRSGPEVVRASATQSLVQRVLRPFWQLRVRTIRVEQGSWVDTTVRPRVLSGAAVAPPTFQEGDGEPMPVGSEIVLDDGIEEALINVLATAPGLIEQFRDAFETRNEISELDEAAASGRGLTPVLAGLFRTKPRADHVERSRGFFGKADTRSADEDARRFFAKVLRSAGELRMRDPTATHRLVRSAIQMRLSVEVLIGAVVIMYVENKRTYPF